MHKNLKNNKQKKYRQDIEIKKTLRSTFDLIKTKKNITLYDLISNLIPDLLFLSVYCTIICGNHCLKKL